MACRIKHLKPTEESIQRVIVEGLTALGFTVLVTSRRVKRCPHCGNWQRGDDGATKGIPDLYFTRREWGNKWIGAEIKSATGRLRPEQKVLAGEGLVFVWRSWEDALEAVRQFEGG